MQDLAAQLDAQERLFQAREPEVRAFLPEEGRFDRLRAEARALEERYPDADLRPSLFGVLVGVKDIFHAAGFDTLAGTEVPPGQLQGEEAVSVRRLREAGALVLGKTVTTEFAYFAPGPTRNPHNLEHTPGGSSSGSAAAVAAGLCPVALGTQTIGSISRPAAFCGVVGYKPSRERISRAGVIPLSPSLDHIGVLAADVATAEAAARVLCSDWQDKAHATRPTLGVPEGPYLERAETVGRIHFRELLEHLEDSGFIIRRIPCMPEFSSIEARHNLILAFEAARVHQAWFAQYPDRYHPKTAALIERGLGIAEAEIALALPGRRSLRGELADLMKRHGVDVWLSPPATGPAPKGLAATGDPIMNLPWTHSGLPTISVPAGSSDGGLPMGLQIAAGWRQDEALFGWATQLADVVAVSG